MELDAVRERKPYPARVPATSRVKRTPYQPPVAKSTARVERSPYHAAVEPKGVAVIRKPRFERKPQPAIDRYGNPIDPKPAA